MIDFTAIRHLPALNKLDIGRSNASSRTRRSTNGLSDLGRIAELVPGLTNLGFLEMDLTDQIAEIAQFAQLKHLSLRHCKVVDLAPLADIGSLTPLQIASPADPIYLSQITRRPPLR